MDPIQKLARRLRGVERLAFKAATQPQLAYSSIEDGAIQSVEDGSLKAIIGKQFDGTQAITLVNGPVPPVPSAPGALAALEGAVLSWDGLFADGSVAPMDFTRVEVHASTDPAFTAEFAETLKATFETPRGGQVFVSLPPAEHYVRLVTRTSSGARSEASVVTAVTPEALADALPDSSDGLAPSASPTPAIKGGVGSLFVTWDAPDNPDSLTYEVHISETSGFTPDSTTLSAETPGTLHVIKALPDVDGTPLDYETLYYVRIIAKDIDGAAAPSIEVAASPVQINSPDIVSGAVTADKILANAVTAEKLDVESVTAEKLASLLVLASKIQLGDNITLEPDGANNGIRVQLPDGGHIYLPTDGTAADFHRVILQATELVVEDKLTVNGVNNRIAGSLALNSNVVPPAAQPTVTSVDDQSPITTGLLGGSQTSGLGDNGTKFEVGTHWAFDSDTCLSTLGVKEIDKATGSMTTKYETTVNLWQADLAAAGISTPLNDGWQIVTPTPPTPTLVSFHSNATRAVFVFLRPAWSGTRGFNVRGDTPTAFSFPAQYRVVVVNNVSPGAIFYHWQWSTPASYAKPAVYLDPTNTYTYVGATRLSDGKQVIFRYGLDGSGGTSVMTTAAAHPVTDWNGLYVGNADFGALRYVMTYPGGSGSAVHVWDSAGVFKSNEYFTPSNGENPVGISWDGTRFRTAHMSSVVKIRKYSTLVTDAARSVKYTWYNSSSGSESTASPVNAATQTRRKWLQVTGSSIPTGSSTAYPNSIRIYVAAHRQADLAVGALSAIYETPSASGSDSPAIDGFASLGNAGTVQSGKSDTDGPIVLLKGDGSGRVGPLKWDVNGADVSTATWHYVGTAGEPAFQNSWANYSSVFPVRFMKHGRTVRLGGWPKNGTASNIFILPAGYRPSGVPATGYLVFTVLNVGGNVVGWVTVAENGQVATNLANGTGASWPTLDSISFDAN